MRRAVEAFLPWFDRSAVDRERYDTHLELARSRATREFARQELLRDSFGLAGERLGRK